MVSYKYQELEIETSFLSEYTMLIGTAATPVIKKKNV